MNSYINNNHQSASVMKEIVIFEEKKIHKSNTFQISKLVSGNSISLKEEH
jgi:hypothetical protein